MDCLECEVVEDLRSDSRTDREICRNSGRDLPDRKEIGSFVKLRASLEIEGYTLAARSFVPKFPNHDKIAIRQQYNSGTEILTLELS